MRSQGMTWRFIALLLGAVLVLGCDSGVPNEGDAKAVFQKIWKKEIDDGRMKILSFHETNAQTGKLFGVEIYKVEYEAKVEYPRGLNTDCIDFRKGKKSNVPYWDLWQKCMFGAPVREKGKQETIKKWITFEKTAKGWKGPDGVIY